MISIVIQRTEANGITFQNLQGTGSCLEHIHKNPFIECNAETDNCYFNKNMTSSPLLAINENPQKFNISDPSSLQMLSKCKVCIRNSSQEFISLETPEIRHEGPKSWKKKFNFKKL